MNIQMGMKEKAYDDPNDQNDRQVIAASKGFNMAWLPAMLETGKAIYCPLHSPIDGSNLAATLRLEQGGELILLQLREIIPVGNLSLVSARLEGRGLSTVSWVPVTTDLKRSERGVRD